MDLSYIDRFGVEAALGRKVLAFHEMYHMTLAESVTQAYWSRQASSDWGKWAADNPQRNRLLIDIEKCLDAEN